MSRPPLRILYVAYPLLTVSQESAGGAEQMLWTLEREMASLGAITTVAASAGSRVEGELFETGAACVKTDDFGRRNREHQEAVVELVKLRTQEGRPFDLIHDKSGSFWSCGAHVETPILATLHLPRQFYQSQLFVNIAPNVSFNCVSQSQAASFRDLRQMRFVVPNGIVLDGFEADGRERRGLLWIGRICEEKAPHIAVEIALRAGLAITLAGRVYPFSYHQKYFEREVLPRLRQHSQARFVEAPSADLKRRLLSEAQALLITSQVDETSSLVAMEAAACGTPVIAFRRGALPEIVKDGVTGFIMNDALEAIEKLARLGEIDSEKCARYARENFSSGDMAERYRRVYGEIVQKRPVAIAV
jgi:glycosyltransferase involved in cell wall biosynthesis